MSRAALNHLKRRIEIFGISQIIWFLWIGGSMIRKPEIVDNR